MENNQKDKQQFLFQQIIQKNYDPEQFQQYIMQAKPGGDDLDSWSYQELTQVVKNFQKKFNKDSKKGDEEDSEDEKRSSFIDEFIESEDVSTKSKYEEQSHSLQDSTNGAFSHTIKCSQAQPSSLVGKDISVSVIKFDKKEGGIFEQSYVGYYIHTQALGKTVDRRYSDFEWLKSTLQILHPGVPVPPIAKKGQFRRYDDKHLRKRMMILQMFLNKLLETPELRADVIVQQFISIQDKPSFEKFKASYKNSGKLTQFKNVKNMKGFMTSAADQKTNSFLNGAKKHLEQFQPLVKSLYKDFKGAATALQQCGSVLKGLGSTCQTLDYLERKFKKEYDMSYCPNNFFTILSESVGRLAEQLLNQAMIFRTEYYSLIKYDSLYMINMVDHFTVLSDLKEKFKTGQQTLLRKKEKLFSQGHVEKWQLQKNVDKTNKKEVISAMLPRQSKKLLKVRDVYGLYNNQMFEELQRYFNSKNIHHGNRLMYCCRNQTRLCSQMMMIWVDAETNIMAMRENKGIIKC